jgi:hypothetical protein
VLNEEQDGQQPVPQERLVFRGTKTNYGNGPYDQKYSEKKERSPANEDSHSHHKVCGKMFHRHHTLLDFLDLIAALTREHGGWEQARLRTSDERSRGKALGEVSVGMNARPLPEPR